MNRFSQGYSRAIILAVSGMTILMLITLFSMQSALKADAVSGVAEPVAQEIEPAAVSPVLAYQGRVVNPSTGAPLSGTLTFVFRLYNVDSAGTALWTETKDLLVTNGLVSTLLGDTTVIPTSLFTGQNLWLGVKVGADPEATPRQRIAPVVYAMYSDNADRLDGKQGTDYAAAGHNHDAQYVNVGGDKMVANSASTLLSVEQSGTGASAYFSSTVGSAIQAVSAGSAIFATSSIPGSDAIYARNVATTGASWGVRGESTSADGRAVSGYNSAASGNAHGVYGESASATGSGVYGSVFTSGSGALGPWAVYGFNTSSSGAGVRGVSNGYVGIWGQSAGRWGVYGNSTGSSNSFGVYGTVSSGTGNYAGYFAGNVNITGSLSKGSGSFKIDHPLDPENKYLYHSFVESPDMMNVYNGNTTMDANGEAWVQLPDYFEALNRDFRYQLTPIGGPGPNLYIAETVQGNRFKIAGGSPNLQVSWQVTGIRQDAFANANRIQVEVEKSAEEKGSYLYPAALGKDPTLGLDYRLNQIPSETASPDAQRQSTAPNSGKLEIDPATGLPSTSDQ